MAVETPDFIKKAAETTVKRNNANPTLDDGRAAVQKIQNRMAQPTVSTGAGTMSEVPVRQAMTNAGFTGNGINLNNNSGYVEYNGQNVVAPTRVTDGVSYAKQSDIDNWATDYLKRQGYNGIRESLMAKGVDSNRINWNSNTGYVTIDGKDALKPSHIINGTSYGSANDINSLLNTAYQNSGDPLQQATSYVAASGMSNAAKWSDGKLMIGGQQVPVMYVDADGKAYAKKSDIDKAIAEYKQNAGIIGNQGVYDAFDDKYGSKIKSALNDVLNRKQWSYDMDNDPAFQAYKEAYLREGNRAFQNAYAQASANTGGYGSSVAQTAAGQQLNYYQQQLNDRIPELMQNDYSRYLGEQQLRRQALDSLMQTAESDYNKLYTANRDSVSDTNTANYYDYLRDISARDYNRQVETEDRLWDYTKQLYDNQVAQSNMDTSRYAQNADYDLRAKQYATEAQEIQNRNSRMATILSQYQYGDANREISAADAALLNIPPKPDGSYPTIGELWKAYGASQGMTQQAQWDNGGRNITLDTWKINNGLGI